MTPFIIGAIISLLVGICIMGGGKKIVKLTEILVPFMGICYVVVALIVILVNIKHVPTMFGIIFADAFDFKSIFGGVSGSCLIYVLREAYIQTKRA
jgi:AGCS family alanine or glycine:cation symporter